MDSNGLIVSLHKQFLCLGLNLVLLPTKCELVGKKLLSHVWVKMMRLYLVPSSQASFNIAYYVMPYLPIRLIVCVRVCVCVCESVCPCVFLCVRTHSREVPTHWLE